MPRARGLRRPQFNLALLAAVAASLLTAIYHMLKNGTCYQDFGPEHFDRRAKTRQTNRLLARLQNLGYAVQITRLAA